MTPREELTVIESGQRVRTARTRADEGGFDQLPVQDAAIDGIIGVVWIEDLKKLPPDAPIGDHVCGLDTWPPVSMRSTLMEILVRLVDRPACLVCSEDGIVGLIHRSDLNKPVARAQVYAELATVEMGLAQIVGRGLSEESWLPVLEPRRQQRIRKWQEGDRRQGVDLPLIQYVCMHELLTIICRSRQFIELGYRSEEDWVRGTEGLVDLRNTVMHPVRRMFSSTPSFIELCRRVARLRDVAKRLASAGAQR